MMMKVLKQFRVLLRSMDTHYRRVGRRSGLGGAQLWALAQVTRNRGLTVSELAKQLGIHLSTASNLVKRLEELGLVARGRAAPDQRIVRLTATAAGRRKLAAAPKPTAGVLQQALMEASQAELRALYTGLDRLLRRMGRLDRAGANVLIPDILREHDDGAG
jgi:DNA-binding MarR family transcriptional regulator